MEAFDATRNDCLNAPRRLAIVANVTSQGPQPLGSNPRLVSKMDNRRCYRMWLGCIFVCGLIQPPCHNTWEAPPIFFPKKFNPCLGRKGLTHAGCATHDALSRNFELATP